MPRAPLPWLLGLLPAFTLLPALPSTGQEKTPAQQRGPAWKRHVIDDSSRGSDGVRALDVNGDGLLDLTTGWEEGGVVRVYLNPGPGKSSQRWPAVTVGKVGSPEDAVFVDLDGDGSVDVVSSCEGKVRTVFAHWAPKDRKRYLDPSAWTTEPFPAVQAMTQWMYCEPAQIDGQHGLDLIVGAKNQNGQIGWLQAPPNPRDLSAWKYHFLCKAGWVMSLAAADMDGDGDLDVLVSDRRAAQRGCLWLENPGPGPAQTKPWKVHRIGPVGEEVMFLDWADLDGDRLADVLVPTFDRKLYFFRRKPGQAVSWEQHLLPFPERTGSGKAVRVADINLDGKPDLVVSCAHAGNKVSGIVWMSYRRSPADPEWDVHEISGPEGIKFDNLPLIDLDGDGDLDVISTEEQTGGRGLGVVWYENPTRSK